MTFNNSTARLLQGLREPITVLALTLAGASLLSGCAPLMLGSALVGGAMSFTDRRTSGAQLEDETIELKSGGRLRDALGDRAHVNVTSYNRSALLTGEVPTDAARASAELAVTGIENVRGIVNELVVAFNSSLTARSSDTIVTSKVKAGFLDAKDLQSNAIKVVTERGVVYLMGRVTEREAGRAAELARGVGGVSRVIKVFEVISEAELARLQPPAKK